MPLSADDNNHSFISAAKEDDFQDVIITDVLGSTIVNYCDQQNNRTPPPLNVDQIALKVMSRMGSAGFLKLDAYNLAAKAVAFCCEEVSFLLMSFVFLTMYDLFFKYSFVFLKYSSFIIQISTNKGFRPNSN